MSTFIRVLAIVLLGFVPAFGTDPGVIASTYSKQDVTLELDPDSSFWRASETVHMDKDILGKPVPGYQTEVRTRWTKSNLYFLFICPYEQLHLKPNPDTRQEIGM